MKRGVTILVLTSLLTLSIPCVAEDGYFEGYLFGQQAARSVTDGKGWFVGGLGAGFLLGIIGGSAVVVAANSSNPAPDYSLQTSLNGKSDNYRRGYFEGYAKEAKSKNVTSSLIGSTIGVLCAVLYISSLDDSDYYYAARPVVKFSF